MTKPCPCCGSMLPDGVEICPSHAIDSVPGEAKAFKIICDLIHRGVEPVRLSPEDRAPPLALGDIVFPGSPVAD